MSHKYDSYSWLIILKEDVASLRKHHVNGLSDVVTYRFLNVVSWYAPIISVLRTIVLPENFTISQVA